jgi:formylglycine-generating enzyme required for sulfatase activity
MKTPLTTLGLTLVLAATALAAPPQAVTDLSITVVDSAHVRLNWSPVAADTAGNLLDCVVYDLHRGNEAAFTPGPTTWLDSTSTTGYTDSLAGEMAFYRVQVQPCETANPHDMVLVPAGSFMMGSDVYPSGVAPAHQVVLTNDFLLGRMEVTNAQFLAALNWAMDQNMVSVEGDYVQQYNEDLIRINDNERDWCEIRFDAMSQTFYLHAGSYFYPSPGVILGPGAAYPNGYDPANHPVKFVSWLGAACYCDWRSQMEGLNPYYNGNWQQIPIPNNPYSATGYRLPTEAEREYATQYDDERLYPWGSTPYPTCNMATQGSCVGWTTTVSSHLDGASALGLQDMAGNVWEWCNDSHSNYSAGATTNPVGPVANYMRILRGGSWNTSDLLCKTRYSGHWLETWNGEDKGFRLCRTAP